MRMMTIVAIMLACTFIASDALAADYAWTISASSTNPLDNTPAPVLGFVNLFLWFACSTVDGVSAAEMSITGSFTAGLAVTPVNGFLNAGTPLALLLAVGGCPMAGADGATAVIAANLSAVDFGGGGGTLCLGGANDTVDCDTVNPQLHSHGVVGFDSTGGTPCGISSCGTVPVDASTWGSIKSLYR